MGMLLVNVTAVQRTFFGIRAAAGWLPIITLAVFRVVVVIIIIIIIITIIIRMDPCRPFRRLQPGCIVISVAALALCSFFTCSSLLPWARQLLLRHLRQERGGRTRVGGSKMRDAAAMHHTSVLPAHVAIKAKPRLTDSINTAPVLLSCGLGLPVQQLGCRLDCAAAGGGGACFE
jgi:hypothetical protein